jgi:NAD(P)-dependent dehydrogenase (short-subunit alcohol dehydrogenase family)
VENSERSYRRRLTGMVTVVTGANSGIGRAIAELFAAEGSRVVCVDLQSAAPRVDEAITSAGGEAVFYQGDVTSPADCAGMIQQAVEVFGRIDILVNNAGVGVRKPLHEFTDDEWSFVIDVNLRGVFNGVRAVVPHFLAQGHGNIVNMASSLGILASPEYSAYCASKAAVINLTKQLAIDYGPAVRVNCLCPGPIDTARYRGFPPVAQFPDGMDEESRNFIADRVAGLRRVGTAREVAYAALFLASEESSFVTGHALVVDGGQTIDA